VLLFARLLGLAADAARAGGGTVTVRTRRERQEQQPDLVLVEIAVEGLEAVGAGDPAVPALARRALDPAGGELRESGAGFQIALPVAR
jgi:hypothetical protein